MAGLYVHIPFCHSKCSYCDFFSVANKLIPEEFIDSLTTEIKLKRNYLSNNKIKTIYFGGGTPSLLSYSQIHKILNQINKYFDVSNVLEFTLEANPEDITTKLLSDIKSIGVNRLSLGIQSFDNNILKTLNRLHDAETAQTSVIKAKDAGFENIGIDLIYGVGGLSKSNWEDTLLKAFSLPINHLSAYILTIEAGTPLHRKLESGEFQLLDDEAIYNQYHTLLELSMKNDFEHYEISNFAKQDCRSIHNSSYWMDSEYLGFGPSAHSFYKNIRSWNVSSLNQYIKNIKKSESFYSFEKLNNEMKYSEFIIKRLRTKEGIDYKEFEQIFGKNKLIEFKRKISSINSKYFTPDKNKFALNSEGFFISDNIIASIL